jgi:hypothetical protein
MPFFSATVEAVLAGRTVRRARLVRFDFASGTRRFFEGTGTLITPDMAEWHGAGELGAIGDIETARGGQAPSTDFTLSGVDQGLIAAGLASSAESKGREVSVLCQHYDETWLPLDNPYETFGGTMDTLKISATGPTTRTVTLNAEGIFTARGFAPFSYFSDRDQKRLHPGDRGAEYVASMASKSIQWPIL